MTIFPDLENEFVRLASPAAGSSPPSRKRRGSVGALVALASVLVAVVIGVGAVVLLGGHHRTTTTTSQVAPASGNRGSVTGRSAALRRDYPRLQELLDAEHMRNPPRAPMALRPTITGELVEVGRNVTNSRGVLTLQPVPVTERVSVGSAGDFWLTAQLGVICANMIETFSESEGLSDEMLIGYGGGGCATGAGVLAQGLVFIDGVGGTFSIWGLVPAGNKTVSVSFPSGSSQTVPVLDGAFLARFSTRPKSVTFTSVNLKSVTEG